MPQLEAPARGWRERALDAALRAEAYDGQSEDALLREIRRRRPSGATSMLWIDRRRMLWFLQERCANFRSLTAGHDSYRADEHDPHVRPYVGWFAADWEGMTFEAALPPDWSEPGYVIFLAAGERELRPFLRAIDDYVSRPAGRCLQYSHGWASAPAIDSELGKVTWDDVVLPPELLERMRDAVEGFFHQRSAFVDLGFPWRRGVLLVVRPAPARPCCADPPRRRYPNSRSSTCGTCGSATAPTPSAISSAAPGGSVRASWRSRTWTDSWIARTAASS
jgi:hypothetical protein